LFFSSSENGDSTKLSLLEDTSDSLPVCPQLLGGRMERQESRRYCYCELILW